jgi:hypothetical protein
LNEVQKDIPENFRLAELPEPKENEIKFNKENTKKQAEEVKKNIQNYTNHDLEYTVYLKAGESTPFASNFNALVKPNEKGQFNPDDQTVKIWNKLFKDGISITGTSYDVKSGDKALAIDNVKDAVSIDKLFSSIMADKQTNKLLETVTPKPSSSYQELNKTEDIQK